MAFNVAAYCTYQFSVQVSQLIMSLYDKSASFRNNGWSTVKTSSQTQMEGMSLTSQSQRSLSALRNSCLIMVEFISRRRSTVTHTDDPFSAVRSSTSLIFGGPLTLILSALSLSSSALSELIMFYADLTGDSGSQCVEDAIWSTRGLVTLTEEASSRLASQLGTVMHRNLAIGLGALG